MKAEIISIGDEILIGQVINTNSSWMATELNNIGIEVHQITTVSDRRRHILDALEEASAHADLILLTGGLGPTKDDITKQTLCEYFNTELVFSKEVLEDIKKLFYFRGLAVNDLNRKQAEIPALCKPLTNKHGTAPGMWFDYDEKIYVSLPGVPFEMKTLMEEQVLPKIKSLLRGQAIFHKTVLTQGVGESWLAGKIESWEEQLPANLKLAYLPQPGMVRLRLSLKGQDIRILKETANREILKLKKIIPDLIFGYDHDTLEEIVGRELKKRGKTLSIAESCSGGYISHLITSIPGSSDYFKGSVVSYANEIKENILGVKNQSLARYGAVSEVVVKEMALGTKLKFNTDYTIATTGVAGPGGGSEEKPVGTTWIAVATENNIVAEKFMFGYHRGRNIRKTALQALNMLRKQIISNS